MLTQPQSVQWFTASMLWFTALLLVLAFVFAIAAPMLALLIPARAGRKARMRLQQGLKETRPPEEAYADFLERFGECGRYASTVSHTFWYLVDEVALVPGFPVYPDDSLTEVFGIYTPNGPDIQSVVRQIACRCGAPGMAILPDFGSPRTVAELVRCVTAVCERLSVEENVGNWRRYTPSAQRAVTFAQRRAEEQGEDFVSTEHILLGLIRERDGIVQAIFDRVGIRWKKIQVATEARLERGPGRGTREVQLTGSATEVMDLACDESWRLNDAQIGTEHLLVGLLREESGLAGEILRSLGFELGRLRAVITESRVLLRAADAPEDSTLLRPAAENRSRDNEALLRPVEP